jgi:hypothetical protein
MTIESEAVPVEHRRISISDIRLDGHNPRIQHAVQKMGKGGDLKQEDLQKLILDQPGVSSLFRSIRDNGGLFDPIFIRSDGTVIEGNCRAAAYLKLHGIKREDPRWQTIPAVLVPGISDRHVAILQGQYHVAGKNKWLAYEKAGHLHFMRTTLNMDEKSIAQTMSMTEGEVIRDLLAYETMKNKLLPRMPGGNELDKWSFVQEFYKRKKLTEYRSIPANVDEFVSLIVEKKIRKGVDVRKLEKLVEHPTAMKSLRKQGVDAALKIVGKTDPTADSAVFKKLKDVTKILKHLPQPELQRVQDGEEPRVILRELFAALKDVAKAAGIKLS